MRLHNMFPKTRKATALETYPSAGVIMAWNASGGRARVFRIAWTGLLVARSELYWPKTQAPGRHLSKRRNAGATWRDVGAI
jgi:hypothetical protein